ncbi:MAG: terminase small subunit [Ruminococcus callidus]
MLTEQRKQFVDEYIKLKCKNQRQAAINAGYSPKSAAQQACDLLKNPEVQEYLQKQKAALIRRIQEELAISASDAVATVYAIMMDSDAKDADRLKAAFDILDRAGFRPDDRDATGDAEAELPKLLEALQEQEETSK